MSSAWLGPYNPGRDPGAPVEKHTNYTAIDVTESAPRLLHSSPKTKSVLSILRWSDQAEMLREVNKIEYGLTCAREATISRCRSETG